MKFTDSYGAVSNEIVQHHYWLPTFLAVAGEPDIVEKCKKSHKAAGKTFKVHLDGYNLLPYLTGTEKESPRKLFMYFSDDGDVVALRYHNWKVVFMEQRCPGTLQVWAEPFTPLRIPKLYNLRTDPFERADTPRTRTVTGFSTTATSYSQRRRSPPNSPRRSRTSRRVRRRPVSLSIRRSKRWPLPAAAPDTERL
jgi:arylsulfatase A-like enzyme